MAKVTIVCDRCHESVEGLLTPFATAGFYAVYQETNFHGNAAFCKYGREREDYICDHCMWADPMYQADYGAVDAQAATWLLDRGKDVPPPVAETLDLRDEESQQQFLDSLEEQGVEIRPDFPDQADPAHL